MLDESYFCDMYPEQKECFICMTIVCSRYCTLLITHGILMAGPAAASVKAQMFSSFEPKVCVRGSPYPQCGKPCFLIHGLDSNTLRRVCFEEKCAVILIGMLCWYLHIFAYLEVQSCIFVGYRTLYTLYAGEPKGEHGCCAIQCEAETATVFPYRDISVHCPYEVSWFCWRMNYTIMYKQNFE